MSWHTWYFGRQRSAGSPCPWRRKEQMVEMNGVWSNHSCRTLTVKSWGSDVSWLVAVMGNFYSGFSSTNILGICVNESRDLTPFHFSLKWFGPEKRVTALGIFFFPFILRLFAPLGQSCLFFFSGNKMDTQFCRSWGCVLHPDYQGQRQWALEAHNDPGLSLSLAPYCL